MKIIMVKEKTVMVSDEDFNKVSHLNWYINNSGYASTRRVNGKGSLMHRIILCAEKYQEIDHIDGNRLNNQRENLRFVSRAQNNMNQKPCRGKTSKYKGVYFAKDRMGYRAQIKANNKCIKLGTFNTEIEAARAYNESALKYFGQYARLNELNA